MRPLALDANLLVLLVVGLASRDLVGKHKRLREYSLSDFDLLTKILAGYNPIVVTPNIWTETSNIARQISGPAREKVCLVMRRLIGETQEAYISSGEASSAREFVRLGLSDSALLELRPTVVPILTSDLDLYLAAQSRGRMAFNFNHLRDANPQ